MPLKRKTGAMHSPKKHLGTGAHTKAIMRPSTMHFGSWKHRCVNKARGKSHTLHS